MLRYAFRLGLAAIVAVNPVTSFAGGRLFRTTTNHCYTHSYNQVQAIAVAAVPLTTVPVAVDVQAYQYSVNRLAFTNFQNYAVQQYTQAAAATTQPQQQPQSAQLQLDDEAIDALAARLQARMGSSNPEQLTQQSGVPDVKMAALHTLATNCMKCHNDNNKQGGLALFNANGDFYTDAPFAK